MSNMRRERLRIVVCGLIAQYPLGGVTWDYLQYVVGLARLGHEVFYIEDTGQWPYSPIEQATATSPDYNVAYLAGVMTSFGLQDYWAYRFPWRGQWFGLSDVRRRDVIASADFLINVSGCLAAPMRYRSIERLAYIDSDPVFTQLKLARGQLDFRRLVDAHDIHFSFGERLDCTLPDTGHVWLPTRQPVLLDCWRTDEAPVCPFTTVMNWSSYNSVEYRGIRYGQKDGEFMKFADLPQAVRPAQLEVAMSAAGKNANPPLDLLRSKGWIIRSPDEVAGNVDSYRRYIQTSKAEWSVAKNGYVQGRPGWFSCRSACYLAAGRPVAVQETGFSEVLPIGEGLLSFDSFEGAAAAIRVIEQDYTRHAKAARDIAEAYFDANHVLSTLLDRAASASSAAGHAYSRVSAEQARTETAVRKE